MLSKLTLQPKKKLETINGRNIILEGKNYWIIKELEFATQEIGHTLKPLFKLNDLPCEIITLMDEESNARYIGHLLPSGTTRNQVEQTVWLKFIRKNTDQVSLYMEPLGSILFFRFLVGFAINPNAIEAIKYEDQVFFQSIHEGRLDQRKRSDLERHQYEGKNWEVYGNKKPMMEVEEDDKALVIRIDAQVEVKRIVGSLKRMAFERWLEKVRQIIHSISSKYDFLIAEMREKVTSVVEFDDECDLEGREASMLCETTERKEDDQGRNKDTKAEVILPKALGKWKRQGRATQEPPTSPVSVLSLCQKIEWQTSEDYPQLEISFKGRIRNKKDQRSRKICIYDEKPYIILNRKKVRADKLVWKTFSDYEGKLGALMLTALDEDPSNIAFSNLTPLKSNRSQFRKPKAVLVTDVETHEEVEYPSLNQAASAHKIPLSQVTRLCENGDHHEGYYFQFANQ